MTLQGSIQDSFLERGLFDCTVTLMRVDSTAVECQPKVYEIGNDAMHISTVFYINVPQRRRVLLNPMEIHIEGNLQHNRYD